MQPTELQAIPFNKDGRKLCMQFLLVSSLNGLETHSTSIRPRMPINAHGIQSDESDAKDTPNWGSLRNVWLPREISSGTNSSKVHYALQIHSKVALGSCSSSDINSINKPLYFHGPPRNSAPLGASGHEIEPWTLRPFGRFVIATVLIRVAAKWHQSELISGGSL